ncbi:MAG: phosphoglucosamine mutase, partial [Candidatus Eremiobacteraeota bacterium]|nr:phosphoglucosamine mutase [Candidatus Eremiobacteraeota bacterium]
MRGVANKDLTPEVAFAIGRAGSAVLARMSDRHKPVIIGRDTRLSGTMLEAAIVAGVTSVGRDAVLIGVIPTPAVARVTVLDGAAAGIMISASHNPIADNGIKFFGPDGFKLSDQIEDEIESLLDSPQIARPIGGEVGIARIAHNLGAHYINAVVQSGSDLSGMTIVVDAAFGAAFAVAPVIFARLGAQVVEMNCEADGGRINVQCGATNLRPLAAK